MDHVLGQGMARCQRGTKKGHCLHEGRTSRVPGWGSSKGVRGKQGFEGWVCSGPEGIPKKEQGFPERERNKEQRKG